MIRKLFPIAFLSLVASSCSLYSERGTIAELKNVEIEIADVEVDGGLDKAMESYRKFLEESPESTLTPEAIRRLADLKVEKEYGVVADNSAPDGDPHNVTTPINEGVTGAGQAAGVALKPGAAVALATPESINARAPKPASGVESGSETDSEFEQRATQQHRIPPSGENGVSLPPAKSGGDLRNAGAEEAIVLYKTLLEKYPMYDRNDQVLYQLSRAYEETGQVDKAMHVMNRLVREYPGSRYSDEVNFRRGEYYFTRKKYLDAEEAYGEVLKNGVRSVYYERALYKKGWTFYKQELYEEALHQFIALLDHKDKAGYDFENIANDIENKRVLDTFRVVSLSFNSLGGAAAVKDYFDRYKPRPYEDHVYQNLAEYYYNKRRYSDAAGAYNAFVETNPHHKKAPHFSMRVIDIYMKGGFPRLVIGAKKDFVSRYGLKTDYWNYFNHADYPDVVGYLKTNIIDLANHFHALYQDDKFARQRPDNFSEASRWYREYLDTFPADEKSAGINYQLADLLLENKDYDIAALEYERSAYDYPVNENTRKAAYAAVYAYREHLKTASAAQRDQVKQEIIRTSLRLVDNFPRHEKSTLVLGAAIEDLFAMRDYSLAVNIGRRLIDEYPEVDQKILRGAWLVIAHSSYELKNYEEAELAYIETLELTKGSEKDRKKLIDNLAASIYKQGEKAKTEEDYQAAVGHFMRISELAPTSDIRPSAEYDAAALLIQIMDLRRAIGILISFRESYPGHELQKSVTKKIAYAYMELGDHRLAAEEYERVAKESEDKELIREAMYTAAELYEKADETEDALRVYQQFVEKYPEPLELALETYYKIAMMHKSSGHISDYKSALKKIIDGEHNAGAGSTARTKYLAAQASLVMIQRDYEQYLDLKLVKPFKESLSRKKQSMKALVGRYTQLADYRVADVTAASTYYIAEIYYNFSQSLLKSERPDDLTALELEEFNLMVEEQAFPFEEKAIEIHENNVSRLSTGIYSAWIDKSIGKLASLVPARYGKQEESLSFIANIGAYSYRSPYLSRNTEKTAQITKDGNFREQAQNQEDNQQEEESNADNHMRAEQIPAARDNAGEYSESGADVTHPAEQMTSTEDVSTMEAAEQQKVQQNKATVDPKTDIHRPNRNINEPVDPAKSNAEAPSTEVPVAENNSTRTDTVASQPSVISGEDGDAVGSESEDAADSVPVRRPINGYPGAEKARTEEQDGGISPVNAKQTSVESIEETENMERSGSGVTDESAQKESVEEDDLNSEDADEQMGTVQDMQDTQSMRGNYRDVLRLPS